MIRAVLDTNVLASGVTHAKGPSGQVVIAWRRRAFRVVVSQLILDELAETLEGRYFKKRLTRRQRQGAIAHLRRQAQFTEVTAQVTGVDLSAEDAQVLATAESAGAAYVVTGDEQFLALTQYHDIRILTPAAFLAVLRQAALYATART